MTSQTVIISAYDPSCTWCPMYPSVSKTWGAHDTPAPMVPKASMCPWCPGHSCAHGAQGIHVRMVRRAYMCPWCPGPTCAHGIHVPIVPRASMCPWCPGHPSTYSAKVCVLPFCTVSPMNQDRNSSLNCRTSATLLSPSVKRYKDG